MNKHKISSFFGVVLFVVLSICLLYVSRGLAQTKGAKPDQNSKRGQVSADAAQPGVVASATSPQIQAERSGVDVPTGTADCVPGTWATSTIGPSARYRHGGVSDGTYIYVFGGGTSTGGS